MMNDCELLELSAKAAGYEIIFKNGLDDDGYDDGIWKYTWIRLQGRLINWNPLTDDGDALRLAVKLELSIDTNWYNSDACWFSDKSIAASFDSVEEESNNGDQYAATRRAIVRAAAEIGKAMK